jgi:hypothetical protein
MYCACPVRVLMEAEVSFSFISLLPRRSEHLCVGLNRTSGRCPPGILVCGAGALSVSVHSFPYPYILRGNASDLLDNLSL